MTAAASSAPKHVTTERVRKVPDDVVTGNSLARHLGCSRQNIAHMAQQGVLPRRSDGNYDQSTCRLAYIQYLRAEYRKSPRHVTDAELQKHRARLYAIKVQRAEGELMPTAECWAFLDEVVGLTLSTLSGWPARLAGHDLTLRRRAERLVFELRTELAAQATERAGRIEAAA